MGNLDMSRFSHLVKCDSSKKQSFYRIFPRTTTGKISILLGTYVKWLTSYQISLRSAEPAYVAWLR